MSYFLLVSSDKKLLPSTSAYEYVEKMLNIKRWNLYEKTAFQKLIKKGDSIAFYIGGIKKNAGKVYARATVGDDCIEHSPFDDYGMIIKRQFKIENVSICTNKFDLRKNINSISFGEKVDPSNRKWGSVLMGGIKKLSKKDWELIFK